MDEEQIKKLVSDYLDLWLIAHRSGADMSKYKDSNKAVQAYVKAI